MKRYEVTLYYHTYVTVEVRAENEEDAIADAYEEAGKRKYDGQFLNHVQEDGDPDIEEMED